MDLLKYIFYFALVLSVFSTPATAIYGNLLINQNESTTAGFITNIIGQSFLLVGSVSSVNLSLYTMGGGFSNIYLTLSENSSRETILSTSSILNVSTGSPIYYNFNLNNITVVTGIYYIKINIVNTSNNLTAIELCSSCYADGSSDLSPYDVRFQVYGDNIILTYPANGSLINKSYPPLITPINFTWLSTMSLYSHIIISKDVNFNIVVYDSIISTNYTTQSLEASNYWWKVRYYNATSGTYFNWSNVANFTLNNTYPAGSGARIFGTVYTIVNGAITPISGAEVRMWNNFSTVSNSMITGSNGYYEFPGLINSATYYLQAKKPDEYDDSNTEIVTTGIGTGTEKNLLLVECTVAYNCYANKQNVKFTIRWLYCVMNCNIQGVTVNIYSSSGVLPIQTGITGSDGSASFLLSKKILYRVTAVNTTKGINNEMTVYPTDNEYLILISNTEPPGFTKYPIQERDGIKINISKNQISNSSATITVNYTDYLSATTGITIYLNITNTSEFTNPINIATWSAGAGNQSHTFSLTNYSQQYLVHILATHGVYGTIDRTYSVQFMKYSVGISGIPEKLWLWFAIVIMFFTGAVFPKSAVEIGFIALCGEGWLFLALGMFAVLDQMVGVNQTQFAIWLTIATIIAFLTYFRKSQNEAGYT